MKWKEKILFKLVKYLIRKYFSYNLKSIDGNNGFWKYKTIFWQWTFEDEKYENWKNGIRKT